MRRNPNFVKVNIGGETHLLPIAQERSDFKKSLRLNKMGAFLWTQLKNDCTAKELLTLTQEHFEIPPEQSEDLKKDIMQFLQALNLRGMLLDTMSLPTPEDDYQYTVAIAGLRLGLFGPAEAFSENFLPFRMPIEKDVPPHQSAMVLFGAPAVHENGVVLIRNQELTVMELPEKYILLFHTGSAVRELHLTKDATVAQLYCIPDTNNAKLQEDIFHALRFAFLYLAQNHKVLAIHSASVLYKEKAWLFSASSGTGKSTHAALWHNILNAPYLNGDLNLITFRKGTPYACGLPWCGTSNLFTAKNYELGGIIFLKQAEADSVEYLDDNQKLLALSNRIISPVWDPTMLEIQLQIASKIVDAAFLCRLQCTPTKEALAALLPAIDEYLSEK